MLYASYSCLSGVTVFMTLLLAQFYHCIFYLCVLGEWWGDITYFLFLSVSNRKRLYLDLTGRTDPHPRTPDFELEAVMGGDFGGLPREGVYVFYMWKEWIFDDQKAHCGRNSKPFPPTYFLFFLGPVRVQSPLSFAVRCNQLMSFHQQNMSRSAAYCFWAKTFKRDVKPLHVLLPFSVDRMICLRNGRATLVRRLYPWIFVWTVSLGKEKTFTILESFSIWVCLFPQPSHLNELGNFNWVLFYFPLGSEIKNQ